MKNLITYLKTLWSWVSGSQRKKIGVTLGEATIEHPFSTYSAPFGTCWQPSGKLHSVVRCAAMVLFILTIGVGNAWGDSETYTFKSASWTAKNSANKDANWTSGSNGNSYNSGVQITTGTSGANATSPSSFNNISSIVVHYHTNKNDGVGTIKVKVGTGTEKTFSVTKPAKDAGLTSKSTTFSFSPAETGNVKITGLCTKNSVYIESVEITYSAGSTKTLVYNANGGTGTMENTTGATVNAATCTFTPPTCKVFDHWNTDSNNEGTSYDEGDAVAASTTLYAIWRNNPSDPTITFSNGNYTTGGSALNLSSLFSSNSSGTVTYSVTNAGGTGANIAGTSFSATTAGSCTVQASQAADAPCYNAKTATATITVSAPTPATITLVNYDGDATTTGYYSGGSFTLPDENDFVCGDLTFVGWSSVTIDNSATKPSAATYHEPGESVTLGASNTFYAVFAEASGGGGAATYTKVTTISAGTYLMAIENATQYTPTSKLAYTGDNGSGKRGGVVTVSISDGVISTKPATALEITVTLGTGDDAGYFAMYDGSKYITQGAKNEFAFVDDISYQWDLNANGQIHQKGTFDGSNDNRIYVDHGNSGSQTNLFKPMKVRTEGDNSGSYFYHAYLFKKSSTISYSNYTTNCVNMRTVYLDAYHFGDSDGAKFAIYSWKNGSDPLDDKLADAFMTKETDCALPHLYVGEYPDNHDRIIFLRNAAAAASPVKSGVNKLNQTSNITTDADKDLFTIASGGGGDTYTGSWSVYTKKYAVTFDKNGVTSTSTWPSDQCIAKGGKVTDPNVTPLAMGKTFVGWYQEAGGTNAWVFNTNTVTAATTIYAKWNDVATKTTYLDASATLSGDKTWDADNTVLFARAYIDGTTIGTNVKATSAISSCQPHVYQFVIPGNATHVSFARCATGTTELPASWTNPPVYNQIAGKTIENGKDHYVIDGWESATLQSSAFTPVSYTITYNAGTNGTGSRANDSKLCGVAFTLPNSQVFTRNGYTMNGWATSDGGDKVYNLGESYTTDANLNLYPHWTEATYTVTLTTNGGTINAGNVTSYVYGTGATLPTDVTKAHATFQGWYASSTFEGERVYSIGTTEYGNKQYYAKWEDVKWTVTWKANGATVRTDANIVDGNKVASVPSAPSDLTTGSDGCDAEFVGWVIEANDPGALSISSQSSTPSGMFTNVAGSPAITGNVTFVAIYRQEQ